MLNKSIIKRLLNCIQTTIGSGFKGLLVPQANSYSFTHGTTTELRANYYWFHPCPNYFATSSKRCYLHINAAALKSKRPHPQPQLRVGTCIYRLATFSYRLSVIIWESPSHPTGNSGRSSHEIPVDYRLS